VRYELLFPGNYLRGVDLLERGDRVVTMTAVKLEELARKGTSKVKHTGVLTIAESDRRVVLCRTNADTIARLYGKDTAEWIGKQITIYFDPEVMFGPDKVGGIRVRPRVPPATKAKGSKTARPDSPPDEEQHWEAEPPAPEDGPREAPP
jgi:hypothetical protein